MPVFSGSSLCARTLRTLRCAIQHRNRWRLGFQDVFRQRTDDVVAKWHEGNTWKDSSMCIAQKALSTNTTYIPQV